MHNYLHQWKALTASADIPGALQQHFSYLADTPGAEGMLKTLMDEAVAITFSEERLTIRFRNDLSMHAYPPAEGTSRHYPAVFRNLLDHHALLILESHRLALGEHLYITDENIWHDAVKESFLQDPARPQKPVYPLWDYSDCWVYHPAEKNATNEPTIYFLSHASGKMQLPQPYNAGTLFLKRCLEAFGLPVLEPPPSHDLNYKQWYEELDEPWKLLLANNCRILQAEDATAIAAVLELFIDAESGISSLAPVTALTTLEELYCHAPGITDLSPLQHLPVLNRLIIGAGQIRDLAPLQRIPNLEYLTINNSAVTDLSGLANMAKLKDLDLDNTPISDIAPLATCKQLDRLSICQTMVSDATSLASLSQLKSLDVSGSPIASFEFLNGLIHLEWFKANNTSLDSLPYSCSELLSISCKNTALSFRNLLQYQSHMLMLRKHPGLAPVVSCDHYSSNINFITALEKVSFDVAGLEDIITIKTNDHLLSVLKKEADKPLADRLLRAWLRLGIMDGQQRYQEELAGNALVGILQGHISEETTAGIFKSLVRDNIQLPRLGYNLACYYAFHRNKPLLFRYVKFAIGNGYPVSRFRTDADFVNFHQDEEFLSFLDSFVK